MKQRHNHMAQKLTSHFRRTHCKKTSHRKSRELFLESNGKTLRTRMTSETNNRGNQLLESFNGRQTPKAQTKEIDFTVLFSKTSARTQKIESFKLP